MPTDGDPTSVGRGAGIAPAPRFESRRHWLRWAVFDNELQRYAFDGRTWRNRLTARVYADALNHIHYGGDRDER